MSFVDTLKSEYRLERLYNMKAIIVTAFGLMAMPWTIASLIVAVLQWDRQKKWTEARKVSKPYGSDGVLL